MACRHTTLDHVHIEYQGKTLNCDVYTGLDVMAAPQLICGCCGDRMKLPGKVVGRIKNGDYKAGRVAIYEVLCKRGTKSRLNSRMRREVGREAQRQAGEKLAFYKYLDGKAG